MVGALSELAGAIAVVASLIYVGKQVQDGSKQTRVNTSSNLASNAQDGWLPIYNSAEHSRIWSSGRRDISSLTEEERDTFLMLFDRQLFNYETAIVAFHEGAYDQQLFESYTTLLKSLIHSDGGQFWLANEGFPITDRAKKHLGVS
jgi:hypothetical protein